jgi:hypothetical protein
MRVGLVTYLVGRQEGGEGQIGSRKYEEQAQSLSEDVILFKKLSMWPETPVS